MGKEIINFEAKAVGATIRERRKEQKLRLRDIARQTDLSVSYLSDLERGHRLPSVAALQRILGALGLRAEIWPSMIKMEKNDSNSEPQYRLRMCPFCGSQNLGSNFEIISPKPGYVVQCEDCRASGPTRPTVDAAVFAWNKWGEI